MWHRIESFREVQIYCIQYTGRPNNRGHFVLRSITSEILNRSLPNLAQIKVTSSEHRAIIYLNQLWNIVAPSSEWQPHYYNYKFWIGDHFLTSFQPNQFALLFHFLPARRYASVGNSDRNVSVRPSVCLSVRLSVMRRYCVKTKKASGMISSLSGSPKTSFLTPNFTAKF